MNTIELTEHQKQYINPNAKLWLEILKFDGVPQTSMCLQNSKGYCCLGVGCEVYEHVTDKFLGRGLDKCYSGTALSLPYSPVVDFLGLNDGIGSFEVYDDEWTDLAELNDSAKYTFPQIADFCLEHYEHVFVKIRGEV